MSFNLIRFVFFSFSRDRGMFLNIDGMPVNSLFDKLISLYEKILIKCRVDMAAYYTLDHKFVFQNIQKQYMPTLLHHDFNNYHITCTS